MKYIDKNYIRLMSSYLEMFKETTNEVYQFRCTYCGDSDKSKTLARAYIYEADNTYLFKCHNCGHSTNLRQFIKSLNFNLYTDYCKDKLLSKGKTSYTKVADEVVIDDFKTNTEDKFSKRNHIGNKILNTLDHADSVDISFKYLKNRNIPVDKISTLYYTDNINKITSRIPKYKDKKFVPLAAIVIPYIDSDGIVTHLQLRMFEGTLRYMTIECEPDKVKIYGLDQINENDRVYIFEGPFDSMFCNGVAVANGALHTMIPYFGTTFKKYTLVYDKDFINNKHILDSLQKSIIKGCDVLLYDKSIIDSDAKDLNDMISDGLISEINSYMLDNTYNGFKAKMYLDKIKQIDKRKSPFSIM